MGNVIGRLEGRFKDLQETTYYYVNLPASQPVLKSQHDGFLIIATVVLGTLDEKVENLINYQNLYISVECLRQSSSGKIFLRQAKNLVSDPKKLFRLRLQQSNNKKNKIYF